MVTEGSKRALQQAAIFCLVALAGYLVLLLEFGWRYVVFAAAIAILFAGVDYAHWAYNRAHGVKHRVATTREAPRDFILRDLVLPVGVFVGGTAFGVWVLNEVQSRTDPGVSLSALLVALATAGLTSFAIIGALALADTRWPAN